MKSIYIKIYLLSIIPAVAILYSEIENPTSSALVLLGAGFFTTFVIWKKDKFRFLDRFF